MGHFAKIEIQTRCSQTHAELELAANKGGRCGGRSGIPVLSALLTARVTQVVVTRAFTFLVPPEKSPFVAVFVAVCFSESDPAMTSKTVSFRVGRVRAYLRGNVWYLTYQEQGQRRQPRVEPDRDVARQMAAEINGQLEVGPQRPILSTSLDSWAAAELARPS